MTSTPAVLSGMQLFTTVLDAVDDWVKTHEAESTKREIIRAREHAIVEEIRARRDLFITYLERSFDERSANFDRLFAALDKALAEDAAAVGQILASITALAAKSPFADLSNIELVQQRLDDPEHVWEV